MMIAAWIYSKLIADSALITLLGNQGQIVKGWPNRFDTMPLLAYKETQTNTSDGFSDNQPFAQDCLIQIDLFCLITDSLSALFDEVNSLFAGLFFGCVYDSGEVPDPEQKLLHRVVHFSRKLKTDDLI